MQAVLCPVCNGSGKVKKKKCHGCDGKGWVEVSESYPYTRPYPWEPYPGEPWKCKPWDTYPYTWIT